MNFLQLCQKAVRDGGTISGLPNITTVVGATGRLGQLVDFVRDAWQDIQNERSDWLFMRRKFEVALTPNMATYSADDLGLERFSEFLTDRRAMRTFSIYDPDTDPRDERALTFINYDEWYQRYGRGQHDANYPSEWSISYDGELLIGNTPDRVYRVRGEYRMSPQILQADTDVPAMPEQFHRVIVADALRLAARSDEAFQTVVSINDAYTRLRQPLINAQTPKISMVTGSIGY